MLDTLSNTPSWEWPENSGEALRAVLLDRTRSPEDRLLAGELCGEFVVADEEMADALLTLVVDGTEDPELRGRAAISLGPLLEDADQNLPEFPEDIEISPETFERIKKVLHDLYTQEGTPTFVRRMTLEAAVRARGDWHAEAVRAAWVEDSSDWRTTAIFCMGFVTGFKAEIIEALGDPSQPLNQYWAVIAAGSFGVKEAWFVVSSILTDEEADKELLLAAIEAAPDIRPREAESLLLRFIDSPDPDLDIAAAEALSMLPQD